MDKEKKRKNYNKIITKGLHNISSINTYRDLMGRLIIKIRWKTSGYPSLSLTG